MKRLIIVQIIISLFYVVQCQQIGDECNDGKGECQFISGCPPIAQNLANMAGNIIFCNTDTFLICCPKKVQKAPFIEDKSSISVRKCISYHQQVYEKCDPLKLIYGGTKAEPREFPHMALVGQQRPNEEKINWGCGGTLVSPRWVLTAAHCFYALNFFPNRVRLGELDFSIDTDDAQPQDFAIKQFIPHPEYNDTKNYNDIALIELDREATLNKYVVPACLPLTNGTEFTHFLAAGWGATKYEAKSTHLLKVRLERFDDSRCQEDIEIPDKLEIGIHSRTQLCAGSKTDSKDTCQGDSGGPLFVEHPLYSCMYLLVGVTSFGLGCGIPDSPAVYSRVNLFVTWVENIVWGAAGSL